MGLNVYEKNNYKKGIVGVYNNMAAVYYNLGDFPDAVVFLNKAIRVVEETKDLSLVATLSGNIGSIYSKINDYSNALKYFERASEEFEKIKDNAGIAKMKQEVGYVLVQQKKYSNAFENLSHAWEIALKTPDKLLQIEILWNLGHLFYSKKELNKSLRYYNSCLSYAKEVKNIRYQSEALIAIGKIHYQKNNQVLSIKKCQEGLAFARQQNSIAIAKEGCQCLYQVYKKQNKSSLALTYYEEMKHIEDSLRSEETSNKVLNMEFQNQQLIDSINYVKKKHVIQLKHQEEVRKKENQRNSIIVSLVFIVLITIGLFSRLRIVRRSKKLLQVEKDRSDDLLLNILPADIAEELKLKGHVNAQEFNLVSILFTDFKSFTQTAEKMSAQKLVEEIDYCFKAFDLISDKYNIEKIKTIGDAYMAAGGIPAPSEDFLKNIVLAGIEMQEFMLLRAEHNMEKGIPYFEMRLGIHAGPIVAGVVGIKKFQYDVWGDTVNTASRMESNGMTGKVNVSHAIYEFLKNDRGFYFEYRGEIKVKGKGELKMYFVEKSTYLIKKKDAEDNHTSFELEKTYYSV